MKKPNHYQKIFLTLLTTTTALFLSINNVNAVTTTTLVSGLNAAIGCDLDEVNNHLYFVEYSGNSLRRINLSSSPITVDPPIATGLSHPEDVALDMDHGIAYVTTRDDPGTGGLWKVDIATGTKTVITFNLGAPQQISLDVANNRAFVVGYSDGRLRSIDLTTGVKTVIISGLTNPVGLVLSGDGNYAYVTEQGTPNKISQIDINSGTKVREITPAGLTAPFFLQWTDPTENSLYVVERDPANRVSKIDLITGSKNDAFTGLPVRPSALTVGNFGTKLYVTTDNSIVEIDLSLSTSVPGFMGIGHVPVSSIDASGYATTAPTYFFHVKNAPFGGTLNIFGNLSDMKSSYSAVYYSVYVSKDGASPTPLELSWNTYKWNPAENKYKITSVAPVTGTTLYEIPAEYPVNSGWWYPPFLIMRWPSGENGLYTFTLKIYDASQTEITPTGFTPMTIRVDNNPPVVKIDKIYQHRPPKTEIDACVIVNTGDNDFTYKITAYDAEGHLYNYSLRALYADNEVHSIENDNYNNHIIPPTPAIWNGILNKEVPTPHDTLPCNCAYTFYLSAWGRTINGYNRIQYVRYHKSITVDLPSLSVCP